ncbi:GntR family transcriptional regulator [Streptomyces sp. NPDC005820]|uniref:GntR family transcriptional regulator n=1 Tax=Streptomyces sp. NPDC005820 TaxID=3157069 RepID=UPI0033EA97B4
MADTSALALETPSSEAVYRMLRNQIMTCELSPGRLLTERESAVELGLGLSLVHEVLTRLMRDGLVQAVSPGVYRITPLTLKSANDLLTVWTLLAPEMAALGTSRADPQQAAGLRQLMVEGNTVLAGPPDRNRVIRFIDIAEQVFGLVATASRNERLVETYRSLAGETWRVISLILLAADCVDTLLAAGVTWGSTIEDRDGATATQIVRDVTLATHMSAMRVLSNRPGTGGGGVVLPLRR